MWRPTVTDILVVDEIKVLPKQLRFIQSQKREVLFSGAFGAGKSRAICEKVLEHAKVPGNFVGLCRRERASLRVTTLETMLNQVLNPMRERLGAKVYEHNKSESRITLEGGGEIYYFGFDDELRLGSLGFGAVGIDEATEVAEKHYMMLLGRLRNPADPNPQIFGACNPAGPSHYLYKRFFEDQDPNREVIITKSSDNTFTTDAYQGILDSFTGVYRARYVEGRWVGMEGLVYDQWDRDIHLREKYTTFPWTVCGVDYGYSNPFAVNIWGLDGDMRMHLCGEIYKSHLLPAQQLEILKDIGADLYVCDRSAAALIADMEAVGLPVEAGDSGRDAKKNGIMEVHKLFSIPADGIPRLTVDPRCEHFIQEIESYVWDAEKDEPAAGQADHHMDAWRYLVKWMADNWVTTGQPVAAVSGRFI